MFETSCCHIFTFNATRNGKRLRTFVSGATGEKVFIPSYRFDGQRKRMEHRSRNITVAGLSVNWKSVIHQHVYEFDNGDASESGSDRR